MPTNFFKKTMQNTARTEFATALRALATERGLDPDIIIEAIKQAIEAAFKRDAREQGEDYEEKELQVELDSITGETKVFDDGKDITPPGFGRIAAQTAKQVIHQKIREEEKGAIVSEFEGKVGSLINGMILRFDGPNVRIDIGRTMEAIMPASERVPSERLNANARMTFLLKAIEDGPKGKQLIVTRSDPEFVIKLFGREVPEIFSGSVEVKGIAREAGVRTKMAVFSSQQGVDPVGSCVGQKGVRVQAVTNELNGERIDIILWTDDEKEYIKAALSPATIEDIKLAKKEQRATVKVPYDQLSLAIGKDGQNVRLAKKLTGWEIEVVADEPKEEEKEEVKNEEVVESEVKKETKVKKIKEKKEVKEETEEKEETKEEEVKEEMADNEE